MSPPVLLAVDSEPELAGIDRELRSRYQGSYRVICTAAPDEAVATLTELSDAGEEVALVLAAHSPSEPTAADVLERAHQLHPHARRGLLVDWGEWGDVTTAKAIFDLMALGRIDYFLLRPAVSPDELFHHAISGFLLEWTEARRIAPHTIRIVGDAWAGRAHELRQTLQRCAIPHAFYLADSPDGRSALAKAGAQAEPPCVILPDGKVLNNPTDREIAEATGASIDGQGKEYDVAILGAGPAGLSAAVYAASEGLETLVVDEGGIGGQATSSSLIRNYLGFPRGISGRRLGQYAYEQAWVFGAKFSFMHTATDLSHVGDRLLVTLADGRRVSARAVILAMGAEYRRLDLAALESLHGAGVFYGGTTSEAPAMAGKDAYVVGGANSAGQAALHLADYARRVTLVVRAQSLSARMSHYLVQELEAARNVDVRLGTEVVGGGGDGRLQYLELRGDATEEHERVTADGLFVLVGARPRTEWLPEQIARDPQGFVLTGPDLADDHRWPLERRPFLLETTMPGVFASGDVRHGSVKRVASAVGEGSISIQLVHGLFDAERIRAAESAVQPTPPSR